MKENTKQTTSNVEQSDFNWPKLRDRLTVGMLIISSSLFIWKCIIINRNKKNTTADGKSNE